MARKELFTTPYMWAWEERAEGEPGKETTFTIVQTAPAAVVLPYREEGEKTVVCLMKQYRPEVRREVIKTIGGYRTKEDATDEECVYRNAREKLGLKFPNRLEKIGSVAGYTVIKVSVRMFLTKDWRAEKSPAPGCEVFEISLRAAVDLAKAGKLSDGATVEPILWLALREFAGG